MVTCSSEEEDEENMNNDEMEDDDGGGGRSFSRVREVEDALPDDDEDAVDIQHVRSQDMSK